MIFLMIFHKSMTKGMLTNRQKWRKQYCHTNRDVFKNFLFDHNIRFKEEFAVPYKKSYNSENNIFEFHNVDKIKSTLSESNILQKKKVTWSREASIILVPCIEEYKSAGISQQVWNSEEEIKEIQMSLAYEIINHKDYNSNISLTENFKAIYKNSE